ncbi:polysaccharide lyase family 1 protein [Actinomadura sp. HBU206391]|uniref:pectate lyase family protein n=1 Tax=Actinomadura sp. HBU206391 TaxID=2731692 RepID=UPI00164F06C2|nr:pectate lyase [Actinomadura sp. HBU206391]MBC6457316.1 pectate lyase [Actinomadura sp. HBU206391]
MRKSIKRIRPAGLAALATAVAVTLVAGFGLQSQAQTVGAVPGPVAPFAESSPVGFASMNGGTTGGAGGATVTAGSASQFAGYAQSSTRYIIQINGTISLSGMVKVASNKTIIGVGTSGRFTNGGLNFSGVRNVIVRNLTFSGAADDSINVQEGSTNIWFDHNSLTDGYDGLLDIKRGSDYITVSWNRFFGHDKTALLGHSDDNRSQDVGHLRVTYVHNWFDGTGQRHPRVRFGNPVHVLNNYYSNIGSYGVASTCNAGVLVESNYFENVEDPFHRGEGSSPDGALVARNNYLSNSGSGETGGSVAGIPYSYTVESAANVRNTVRSGAGVGRI